MVDVGSIGQEHIGNGAPILIKAVGLKGDLFPKDKCRGGLLGALAVGLAFLRAVDAAEADTFRVLDVQAIEVLLCRNGCAAAC
jgi:hypothetical protein